jgi:hypothetical protein
VWHSERDTRWGWNLCRSKKQCEELSWKLNLNVFLVKRSYGRGRQRTIGRDFRMIT